MSLKEVQEGKEYIIRQINTNDEELNSFLFSLGCYSGEPITLVSRKKAGCVVSIKDGNFNYYYAINDGKRDDHTTDKIIARISKPDDALVIKQQQFGEIDVKI
jgi:ferrous iron transport protein A